MTIQPDFQKRLLRVISQVSAAISNLRLYLYDHPYILGYMERAYTELLDLLGVNEAITIFLVGEEIVVNGRPLTPVSPSTEKFAHILTSKGIERVTFLAGLPQAEFFEFMRELASPDSSSVWSKRCIKLGKVEIRVKRGVGAVGSTSSEVIPSELLERIVSLTDHEARQVEELYFMVERGQAIDVRGVDQIVRRFVNELQRNLSPITLLASVKSTHEYTYTHLANVCILTMSLAENLGFSGRQLHEIGIASLLHDVGKKYIPDEILSKPGKLTAEERAVIETHPVKGCRYLLEIGGVPNIAVLAALEHHLKYDGTGYPTIRPDWKPNIVAQMITIADVFDALRSRRSYSEPKPMGVIVGILQKESGTTFNPMLVDRFLSLIGPDDAKPEESPQADRGNTTGASIPDDGPRINLTTAPAETPNLPTQGTEDQLSQTKGAREGEKPMEDLLKLEQRVDQHLLEGNTEAAVAALYGLIVAYAKVKDFKKAESLRERLLEVDSLALSEIIKSAEIIEEEKKEGRAQDHLDLWSDLYGMLTTEEGNGLYYAMKEASYDEDQPVFTQGERNSNLYFIKQGRLKMLYNQSGKEVILKMLQPGDIVGEDTFFSESVCTTTVAPFSRVKLNYLEQNILLEWKKTLPGLESKLHDYCLKLEKVNDLLKNRGLDRRTEKRFNINGKAIIQILSVSGTPVGNTFKVGLSDISATGLSCFVKLAKQETARLLLGRSMNLQILVAAGKDKRSMDQAGTIVAVRSNPYDDYSLHIKFYKTLADAFVKELAFSQERTLPPVSNASPRWS